MKGFTTKKQSITIICFLMLSLELITIGSFPSVNGQTEVTQQVQGSVSVNILYSSLPQNWQASSEYNLTFQIMNTNSTLLSQVMNSTTLSQLVLTDPSVVNKTFFDGNVIVDISISTCVGQSFPIGPGNIAGASYNIDGSSLLFISPPDIYNSSWRYQNVSRVTYTALLPPSNNQWYNVTTEQQGAYWNDNPVIYNYTTQTCYYTPPSTPLTYQNATETSVYVNIQVNVFEELVAAHASANNGTVGLSNTISYYGPLIGSSLITIPIYQSTAQTASTPTPTPTVTATPTATLAPTIPPAATLTPTATPIQSDVPTAQPSETPTVPEFTSFAVSAVLMVTILSSAIIVKSRKKSKK